MRIPRDFDRWMFDYKEGNLSQSENNYFENYMSENPQLNSDVEAWNNSYIRKENVEYTGMASLQKESYFKTYMSWASIIIVLLVSSFGSYHYFKDSNVYNPRSSSITPAFHTKITPFKFSSLKNRTKNNTTLNNTKTPNTIQQNKYQVLNHNQTTSTTFVPEGSDVLASKNIRLTDTKLLTLEADKIKNVSTNNNQNNSALYINNPAYKESQNSQYKHKRKHKKSVLRTLKNGLRKIEKISGYPIGLTNLKDPEFIIPTANLFDINSGFVGGKGSVRFDSKYRTQWLGSQNNLQSASINFDTYAKSIRGGIGISLNSNNFNNGLLTDNKVNFIYAPKFAILSNLIFEPAVKLTLGLMTLDQTKINTDNTFEIERGHLLKTFHSNDLLTANNLWYKDYGLGFVLNSEIFYIGFNADNLAEHKQRIYGEKTNAKINYTAILGMDFQSKNRNMILSPFLTYQNNSFINELWAGTNFKYHWFTIGGGYSTKNDFSAAIGIKTKHFKLSYQYDMTTSILSSQKQGSHSIGLRINTNRKH